ncbi:MAG: 4-hydroxy-tetrahydrodipicolinate synthase [Clostridia bacterium]|nr:4-hydroxy-tetrahydrodipicolinate synthase [Clostridia bacterium]
MTKRIIFRGVGTALVTPFRDGKIDYLTLEGLIEAQIAAGIDALIVGGTTGEAATLEDGERYELYGFAKKKIRGRIKLIFGTGTNDTRAAVRHTRLAEELGCDGALLVTPYYNKGTEEGVYRHYLTIAEETSLPIILYNVPSRTGVNLGLNLLERLAKQENIVAIKEASDSVDRLVALSRVEGLSIYSGNDTQIYPTLALGGLGVISVVSNILPRATARICKEYFTGNVGKSLELQKAMFPFIRTLFAETNPAPIKQIMATRGLISPELRLPLSEVRESTKEALSRELSRLYELGIKE